MSPSSENIALLDGTLEDPDEALAVRYMWRHLDDQIVERNDRTYAGKPETSLTEILMDRYGMTAANVEKESGHSWVDAVKLTVAKTTTPIIDLYPAYSLPWTPERMRRAVQWFQRRLVETWPKFVSHKDVPIAFIAEDLSTLWAACVAMDLARIRKTPFADDPFPAQPVLITGPTGTGKELLAEAIHHRSGRGDREKFGALNCGGLPPELLESELFGHVKGAFTGAMSDKTGFVKQYEDGTLFLDEIGDMPATVQVRLLRFLNNGEFRRVGDVKSQSATPRIISATHVDLEARVAAREFREDLFYRVRGYRIRLRALKDRPPETTRTLISRFLNNVSEKRAIEMPRLTRRAWRALAAYEWPGNMRELKYVAEQVVDGSGSRRLLDIHDLTSEIVRTYHQRVPSAEQDVLAASAEHEYGGSARATVILVATIGQRHTIQQRNSDTRAAALTRAADMLERLAMNLGLADQAEFHVKALRAASTEMLSREFRDDWLVELKKYAEQHECDAAEAINLWSSHMDEQASKSGEEKALLLNRAKELSSRYAFASVVASLVGIVESGDIPYVNKILSALEQGTALLQAPPLNQGAQYVVEWMKDMSLDALKAKVREVIDTTAEAEEDKEEEVGTKLPIWKEVRNDPARLRELLKECGGNQAALARAFKIEPRTLYKVLGDTTGNAQSDALPAGVETDATTAGEAQAPRESPSPRRERGHRR
jgi:transcriptional regulator with AAA-type ATPase domain